MSWDFSTEPQLRKQPDRVAQSELLEAVTSNA